MALSTTSPSSTARWAGKAEPFSRRLKSASLAFGQRSACADLNWGWRGRNSLPGGLGVSPHKIKTGGELPPPANPYERDPKPWKTFSKRGWGEQSPGAREVCPRPTILLLKGQNGKAQSLKPSLPAPPRIETVTVTSKLEELLPFHIHKVKVPLVTDNKLRAEGGPGNLRWVLQAWLQGRREDDLPV